MISSHNTSTNSADETARYKTSQYLQIMQQISVGSGGVSACIEKNVWYHQVKKLTTGIWGPCKIQSPRWCE